MKLKHENRLTNSNPRSCGSIHELKKVLRTLLVCMKFDFLRLCVYVFVFCSIETCGFVSREDGKIMTKCTKRVTAESCVIFMVTEFAKKS